TILEPTRITVPEKLKGKARRQAAGASLYDIMSDLMFRTTATDRTVFEAVMAAAHHHGLKRIAVQDPVAGALSYKRLLIGANVLARKLSACAPEGEAVGVLLPNANGAAATILGLTSAGRVPAFINFTAGAINILAACEAAGENDRHFARFHRKRTIGEACRVACSSSPVRLSRRRSSPRDALG